MIWYGNNYMFNIKKSVLFNDFLSTFLDNTALNGQSCFGEYAKIQTWFFWQIEEIPCFLRISAVIVIDRTRKIRYLQLTFEEYAWSYFSSTSIFFATLKEAVAWPPGSLCVWWPIGT